MTHKIDDSSRPMTSLPHSMLTGLRALLPARLPRVVAIIAAFNEEDVIGQAIGDLIENGCEVYLMDNRSTDNTVQIASQWLNRGLLHIESFPPEAPNTTAEQLDKQFLSREILLRKVQLAKELGADWIINTDADELREGPWTDMSLRETFGLVDALGYSAVNFKVLNFRPVDDSFSAGDDLRERFAYFEPGEWVNALQIRAWKHTGAEIDITSSGGHNAAFADQRVFPVPFLLRHYPIRNSAHGRRKILKERMPRYTRQERDIGWHNHYDAMVEDQHAFIWDRSQLTRFDPVAVRAELLGQTFNAFLLAASATRTSFSRPTDEGWIMRHLAEHLGIPEGLAVRELYQEAFNELRTMLEIFQRDKSATNCPTPKYPEAVAAIARVECAKADLNGDYRLSFMWQAIADELQQRQFVNSNVTSNTGDTSLNPAQLLAQAAALIDDGALPAAYELLISSGDALAAEPVFLYQLGRIGVLSDMPEDAINIFEEAARLEPQLLQTIIGFYQGRLGPQQAAGSTGNAIPASLQVASQSLQTFLQLAYLAQTGKRPLQAQELFYQAALQAPEVIRPILQFYTDLLAAN